MPRDTTPSPDDNDAGALLHRLGLTDRAVSLAHMPLDPVALDAAAPRQWPETLARAVPKRRREFLAGRLCARQALRQAGHADDTLLPVGDDRLPIWPAGWRGSISHSALGAVAVVASADTCLALGVDMETWIEETAAAAIAAQIATPAELALFDSATAAHALTRLFCAKEALFKALYPYARRFLDFDAARAECPRVDRVSLRLSLDWSAQWPAGTRVEVRQAQTPTHVYSLVHVGR